MNDDLESSRQRLRDAHTREPMPDWSRRAQRLQRLQTLLLHNRADICAAIDADFGGRPAQETELMELYPSLSEIRHALRHGRRWMRERRSWAGFPFFPARNHVLPQPLGVVGIIVPWNYPLYLAVGPLIGALAAGNRAMLKMSELTPRFSALFAELVHTHFGDDEIRVVNGDATVAQAFAKLGFDHLLFTGSTAIAPQVLHAAAETLTPVTLELGGKSPALIAPGARFEHAVERIMLGKLANAGQTCVAPDYVLLPRAQIGHFVSTARAVVARMYPDLLDNPLYTSIISERHCQRLLSLRDQAITAGAIALALGIDDAHASAPFNGRRLAPTLLLDVPEQLPLMREEIFGPWLPLVPYDTLEQALAYITARPHPLAMYVFDDDPHRQQQILRTTIAGGVTLNDTLYHVAQHALPFGGVGPSGTGSYHGEHGFRTFSHFKPVFAQARLNGAALLAPPYGRRFQWMLDWLLRRG